jgi:ElaB/YqjD/DUF883 family membrane-anchored ribosome-binding protein
MSRIQDEPQAHAEALKEKARDVQQSLRDLGGEAKATAVDAYGNLRNQAQDYIHQGKDYAQHWEQSLEDAVKERPLRAILIAAGAGMLLGLLWRRH